MKEFCPNDRLRVVVADITALPVDAIVNAANESLLGGGGVDGAIHAAAGPELLEACRRIGGCPTGEARITPGFRLPAPWIIHTVGPIWRGDGRENDLLRSCYVNSLQLALEHDVQTIAFPCISTGAYAFPPDGACRIAVDAVLEWLASHALPRQVTFCCWLGDDFRRYQKRLSEVIE
jgi:O-acetyl-ADP-ribose deacetylase (regulator of RNase III)